MQCWSALHSTTCITGVIYFWLQYSAFFAAALRCINLADVSARQAPLLTSCVHVLQCRYFYAIGMLKVWQAHTEETAQQKMQRRLARQSSWGWLAKRWFILHSGQLLALTCFCAAMQLPSALGWLLVAGLVVVSYVLGGGRHQSAARQRADVVLAVVLSVVVALWIAVEYALQVGGGK